MVDDLRRLSPQIEESIAILARVAELERTRIPIPGSAISLDVVHPRRIEDLLDGAAADPEENLPYWADIWPSGIALAGEVLANSADFRGMPVIEIGCGVGITATAATMAGALVTATDYAPESLSITGITCAMAGMEIFELRQVNWRSSDADLMQMNGEQWHFVLAADVLYEERDIAPILGVLWGITAPGGQVWLAEPGRRVAATAIARAREIGWHITSSTMSGPWPGANTPEVDITLHKMVKPSLGD